MPASTDWADPQNPDSAAWYGSAAALETSFEGRCAAAVARVAQAEIGPFRILPV